MRRFITRTIIVLAMASQFSGMPTVQAQPSSFDTEDLLKMEGFGTAEISSTSNWLVYEQKRPYDQIGDYSFRTYAFNSSGHQVWRYHLGTGGVPELLPGLDQQASTYFLGSSPSERFLTIMQYHRGSLSLLAYDMDLEAAARFDYPPAFSRTGESEPEWISDQELVYATSYPGAPSLLTSVRTHTSEVLSKSWSDAWNGDVVTASEIQTREPPLADKLEEGMLVRADARSGRTTLVAQGLHVDLKVSPDHRKLAALSVSKPRPVPPDELVVADPRKHSLVVFDLETNQLQVMASGVEFSPYSISWSHDSTKIAAFGWEEGETPTEGRFYLVNVADGKVRRYDHGGLDLVSGIERGALQRPERAMFLGDRLLVFARERSRDQNPDTRFTYRDRGTKGLTRPDWYAISLNDDPENMTKHLEAVSAVPLHSGNLGVVVVSRDGVYRIMAGGGVASLTGRIEGDLAFIPFSSYLTPSIFSRSRSLKQALLTVTRKDGHREVLLLGLDGEYEGKLAAMDLPQKSAIPVSGSYRNRAAIFWVDSGPVTSAVLNYLDGARQSTELASINTHLANVDPGYWRNFSYTIADPDNELPDKLVEGCVLLPLGSNGDGLPPLIVDVYPGVNSGCSKAPLTRLSPFSPYMWAGRGYAYVRLATPTDYIRTEEGPISGIDEAIVSGVLALSAQGIVDGDRVGLFGFSQGAVSALYVATQTERFDPVIAANGWADLFSHYFGPTGVYSYVYSAFFGDFARYDAEAGSDFAIGKTPFESPQSYYGNSPVFLAPRIQSRVLLIHSDMDGFAMSQFDEMFGALMRSGKDARYVRYWGEGHGPSSPANIRDMWGRIDAIMRSESVRVPEETE